MPDKKRNSGHTPASPDDSYNEMPLPASEPELVVIARPEAALRARATGLASASGADTREMSRVLASTGAKLKPLFGESEERLQAEQTASEMPVGELPDLTLFYRVDAPAERMEHLVEELSHVDLVESVFLKPPAYPSQATMEGTVVDEVLNRMAARVEEAPPATPDFMARQGYLNPAPVGVDAHYAWTQPGGMGQNVNVIDIEGAWQFSHEDLRHNPGGVLGGTPTADVGWRNHGTAVVGVICAGRNTYGITGIAPSTRVRGISIFGGMGSAAAIRLAADRLRQGDLILIELHRPGPRHTFQVVAGQQGFIALEWWPDDYAAIRYAASKGVIVIEAAGNGSENLDDAIYNTNPAAPYGPFPSWWRNPFRRSPLDSGAIVVGAGAPPPGTHGRDHGPDRSRLGFSNFGALVDAQGWGREVTTLGYGDLQGGSNEDEWYTDQFSGTSSASPVVVGSLASVQGFLRAQGRIPLDAGRARELLRTTGSPQQDAPGRPRSQRIGNRPNLRQLFEAVRFTRNWLGVQFRGTVPANQSRRWFTHSWPAHWHVIWSVVPTSPQPGGPQIQWNVQVERATDARITYWITITNLSAQDVEIEARYAVLGW